MATITPEQIEPMSLEKVLEGLEEYSQEVTQPVLDMVYDWAAAIDAALAKQRELQEQIDVCVPEDHALETYRLAGRCLWIAFTWNDHNFDSAKRCARKEAELYGIRNIEDANAWLEKAAPKREGEQMTTIKVKKTDYPECSGNPASCPENEGYGCCMPNPQQRKAAEGVTNPLEQIRELMPWIRETNGHVAKELDKILDKDTKRLMALERAMVNFMPPLKRQAVWGRAAEILREGEMGDIADMLERARSTVMPEDVAYALNRMCTPLDESRLKGVTASEDARCMRVIREYVESVTQARVPDEWKKDVALLIDAVDGLHGRGATDGDCELCDAVNRLITMLAAAPQPDDAEGNDNG